MPEPGFFIKVGDKLPSLVRTLEDADLNPVDLTNSTVQFRMQHIHGGSVLGGSASITSPTGGSVTYTFQTADTVDDGLYLGEWEVTYAQGTMTFPNGGYDLIQVMRDIR